MNFNRVCSGVLYLVYLLGAFYILEIKTALLFSFVFFMVLMTIWFGDVCGEYLGGGGDSPAINRQSPGLLVSFVGWIIFLIPLGVIFYKFMILGYRL